MLRMRSFRFRLWLALAFVAGLASCDLNPQPSLPGTDKGSGVHSGGATTGPALDPGGSGGTLTLNPGIGGSIGGTTGTGAADSADGGAAPASEAGGAGGAGDAEPDAGGAGGAVDTGPK